MLGDNIRAERNRLRMTQRELADKVGIATLTLQKYEANTMEPGIGIACRLAQELHIGLDELTIHKEVE